MDKFELHKLNKSNWEDNTSNARLLLSRDSLGWARGGKELSIIAKFLYLFAKAKVKMTSIVLWPSRMAGLLHVNHTKEKVQLNLSLVIVQFAS